MNRVISIVGDIDETAYQTFSLRLAKLERESSSPVDVELHSGGGSAIVGLAFHDRIRNSVCHITVTAYGCVYSAATLIFAAGDVRRISANAWFMVHDDSGEVTGSTEAVAIEAAQMERMEDQWAELLADRSSLPPQEWRDMSRKTTYLSAKQLFQYGLAEVILKGKHV